MNELKQIISTNIQELRKKKKWTQLDLANELQYSDKAISKWEKGDSLPDIETLYKMCELFGVTLDYLTHEGTYAEKKEYIIKNQAFKNKVIILLLSISLVWFIGIIAFIYQKILKNVNHWPTFIWVVFLSSIVTLVFNSIWGRKKWKFIILSILIWSCITAFYCQILFISDYKINIWPLFLVGIPAQISVILWSQLKYNRL